MGYLKLKDNKGNIITKLPCEWFKINKNQQIACIGGNVMPFGGICKILDDHPEIKALPIGKVSEQDDLFMSIINNSLGLCKWNFKSWPDPEVVLLTKKKPVKED